MLTKEKLIILSQELKKSKYAQLVADQKYQALAEMLNAKPSKPNTTPQPERPKLITWSEFQNALTANDIIVLYQQGMLAEHLHRALDANDRATSLSLWRGLKTVLSATSVTKVEQIVAQKEPDPSWQPTVLDESVAVKLGLGRVYPYDIQAVFNQ